MESLIKVSMLLLLIGIVTISIITEAMAEEKPPTQTYSYPTSFEESYFLTNLWKRLRYDKRLYKYEAYNKYQRKLIDSLVSKGFMEYVNGNYCKLSLQGVVYVQVNLLKLDKKEI